MTKKISPLKTPDESVSKENKVPKIDGNEEISINYVITGERWNRNEIIVDDIFAYHVAQNVANENEDLDQCLWKNVDFEKIGPNGKRP